MADTAMNVDVYDTYALTEDGHRMHFDVFLPAGCGARCDEKAANIARTWLRSIGMNPDRIELEQCRYCHSEAVNPAVSEQLESQGWFILPMEGCPSRTPNHSHRGDPHETLSAPDTTGKHPDLLRSEPG